MSQITVDVDNFLGPTATPMIFSKITIEANGATLIWSGGGHARAFAVGKGGSLTIRNAYIKGFSTKGGDAGYGAGGGGLGAGGAIYVTENGAATIQNSTFDSNSAVGGNGTGGGGFDGGGGGGGGLGGNGAAYSYDTYFGTYPIGGGGGGSRGNAKVDQGGGTVALSFNCGGDSGTNNGSATCPGGGGNGGAEDTAFDLPDVGGDGDYGGGGGGGANAGHGGKGGFGGGGGGAFPAADPLLSLSSQGGDGGFGGGAGNGVQVITGGSGTPGPFGGKGHGHNGGGGAALGGAIFIHGGSVVVQNSTFFNNRVFRGSGGADGDDHGDSGDDAGAAIFCVDCHLTVQNATISGNISTTADGGIKVYQTSASNPTSFTLENTIIWANGNSNPDGSHTGTPRECSVVGFVIAGTFSGNLIENNDNCPGVVSQADPLLGPLQNNRGFTPTMAIGPASAAFNTADPATSLPTDQRLTPRPEDGGYDIGAYEYCNVIREPNCNTSGFAQGETLTVVVAPPAGGTTSPPAGMNPEPQNSVTTLVAFPNPGFVFQGWLGNVAQPTSSITTVVMNQTQTVTADFVPCACASDVSSLVTVTPGSFVFNLGTQRYVQTVKLTNTSAVTITGPFSLVLEALSSNASLYNPTGLTDSLFPPSGLAYINATAASIAPGQSVTITLQFTNPSKGAISYVTRVLAGPGAR